MIKNIKKNFKRRKHIIFSTSWQMKIKIIINTILQLSDWQKCFLGTMVCCERQVLIIEAFRYSVSQLLNSSLKSATMGVFTPWKSENTTNQGLEVYLFFRSCLPEYLWTQKLSCIRTRRHCRRNIQNLYWV